MPRWAGDRGRVQEEGTGGRPTAPSCSAKPRRSGRALDKGTLKRMKRVYLKVPEGWAQMTDAEKAAWSESSLKAMRSSDSRTGATTRRATDVDTETTPEATNEHSG